MELFEILDHTAMTTASHCYIRHCSEQWADVKKIDFSQRYVYRGWRDMGARGHDTAGGRDHHHGSHCGRVFEHPRARRWASGAVHALTCGRRGCPAQCFGCQETGHVVARCPHLAQGAIALGATLPYNPPSTPHQRPDTSAQDMAREVDATRRFQEASAAERRMEASTQKLLLLCERVKSVCDQIFGAATAAVRNFFWWASRSSNVSRRGDNPEGTGKKEQERWEHVFPLVFPEHVPRTLWGQPIAEILSFRALAQPAILEATRPIRVSIPHRLRSFEIQTVQEKMRLEMVIGMQTEILNGHSRSLLEQFIELRDKL